MPSRGHLARDVGYVAVQAGPATQALAAVVIADLPAPASVLTGRGLAPADQVLQRQGGGKRMAHAVRGQKRYPFVLRRPQAKRKPSDVSESTPSEGQPPREAARDRK